jgi:hypothetical protein
MIEHLATLIDTFPGASNQTRCFAHILNLVVKSILRQFEAPKTKGKAVDESAAKELAAVVDEIDFDDEASDSGRNEGEGDVDDDVDDEVVDDDNDGLPDERDDLSEQELLSHKESVKPIRVVLTKVSKFIKHQLLSTYQQQYYSFEEYPWRSKTHPPSYFLSGTRSLRISLSSHASCHAMCPHVGIQRTTWLSSPLSTVLLLTS